MDVIKQKSKIQKRDKYDILLYFADKNITIKNNNLNNNCKVLWKVPNIFNV
jgi:hypothetical protein